MLQRTEIYYKQIVKDVLVYIQNNLSNNLSVRHLAEHFGFSFYHFHRIVKACLNEPLGTYINRLRLETALKIIRCSDLPLSEIAFQIGYNDCSAFSKAFSKEFGLSPLKFKSDNAIVLNTHVDFKINNLGKLVCDVRPKIACLADKPVIYRGFLGEYTGAEFNSVWDDFWGFVIQKNILSWKPDVFSVYHDDPFETVASNCRAECCVATNIKPSYSERFATKTVSGGKYLLFRYQGPHNRLLEINVNIMKKWLPNSNFRLQAFPFMEKYLNNPRFTESNRLMTEIYIPIE